MNRKVNFFLTVSIGTVCDVKSYNKCSKRSLSALTQAHSCFCTSLLPCR